MGSCVGNHWGNRVVDDNRVVDGESTMKNKVQNLQCDGAMCECATGEVRRLPTGSGAVFLCKACYDFEAEWNGPLREWDTLPIKEDGEDKD